MSRLYYLGKGDEGVYGIYIIHLAVETKTVFEELYKIREDKNFIGNIHKLSVPMGAEKPFLFAISNCWPDLKGLNGHRSLAPLCTTYTKIANEVNYHNSKIYDKIEHIPERYLLTKACLIKDTKKENLEDILIDHRFNRLGVGNFINYPLQVKLF